MDFSLNHNRVNIYSKRFYSQNKEKYKKYYQDNKHKILEYLANVRKSNTNRMEEVSNTKSIEEVNLNYKDRYILNKLYEYIKLNKQKCFLQKQNVIYFNENKKKYISYYQLIKNNNKKINHLDELIILGERNFNIDFCSKKCYEDNCLKIEKGPFILTF